MSGAITERQAERLRAAVALFVRAYGKGPPDVDAFRMGEASAFGWAVLRETFGDEPEAHAYVDNAREKANRSCGIGESA